MTAVTRYAWSSVAVQLEQLYGELLRAQARAQDEEAARSSGASSAPRAVVIAAGAAVAPVVGTALAGWAGWALFGVVCLLVADLGLGLVHAQLAALRQGASPAAARTSACSR